MFRNIFFPFVLIFFAACSTKNLTNDSGLISVEYDTIQIPITERYLQNYSHITGYSSDSLDLIYAYNHFLHKMDVFDVTNRRCFNSIPLEREGPDGINVAVNFTVCDSMIYINSFPFYYGINFSGKIETKLDQTKIINFPYNDFNLSGRRGIIMANFMEAFVNCEYKAMPVAVYKNDNSLHGIGFIRLDSGTFEMFDVSLPEIKDNYGHLEIPHINWVGDKIIYNFPYSSSIYVYSIDERTQKEIKVNSVFTKNIADKLNNNSNMIAQMHHQMFSLQFLSVKYDPFRDLYYRIHMAPINNMDEMFDRELYLTVMDNQFNCLKELKLPRGIASPSYVITKNGILFQLNPSAITNADENIMYLMHVEISRDIE